MTSHVIYRADLTSPATTRACCPAPHFAAPPSSARVAQAHYDCQRGRGANYNTALRQLATRLVGILHGCLKTGTTYDETTAWSHHLSEATA